MKGTTTYYDLFLAHLATLDVNEIFSTGLETYN